MSDLLDELEPVVAARARLLLEKAAAEGIVLKITQGFRTPESQAALYAQGRSTSGDVVTHAPSGYSWHEYRRAFDVAIVSFQGDQTPNDLYDGPWDRVGELGESVGLEWGGHWKHPDRPHFQDTTGLSLVLMRKRRDLQRLA